MLDFLNFIKAKKLKPTLLVTGKVWFGLFFGLWSFKVYIKKAEEANFTSNPPQDPVTKKSLIWDKNLF